MTNADKVDAESTINSGQVFLWKKEGRFWYGVNGQDILRVDESGKITKSYQNNSGEDFFRRGDDLEEIIRSISRDKTVRDAVKRYPGLRIARQDPFQCMISFITSSNSNIQKIKSNLENLSRKLGKKVAFDKREFYFFPEPRAVANATVGEISSCGLGYRSRFVIEAAKLVESGQVDFEHLRKCSYHDAREEIVQLVPGIGNKVADCVLLFALDKLEAFPLDRWMLRILKKYYLDKFDLATKSITDNQYKTLHEKIVRYFGPFAGYAQQFLFKMERENHHKKWL